MRELMERAESLAALDRALLGAARGRGSVALVSGEPGIGKSALVTRFAEQHRDDARVLVGLCDDLATPRPLAPFRDIAQALPAAVAESLREATAPGAFPAQLVEELRRGRAPTVLVLEDVHWADQATVDAITVLGRRVASLPVLLVLTLRTGEVEPGHHLWGALDAVQHATSVTLELPPLSRAAVVALAGEDADRVLALTGGNPFFVTELIASREGPPPPSLAHAVLARVARLDERPRALLELVAMVPGRVRTALLDTVEPGWPEQAEQAERRQLLTSDRGTSASATSSPARPCGRASHPSGGGCCTGGSCRASRRSAENPPTWCTTRRRPA
ncbi:hypothetical protein E9549_04310 [Blastococcus sp. MG754426]|uniref:AAA family ATPase n=1 Tax=unclassified Blastococcus TaxID=2619396 RepID=UPI001EF02AB8|nr:MULTISPECIES: AAA family ATPase [unclassified Blastococcus]MCF6506632.1 hypothetical protein [Blastococcus sp. MG754426]MCF6510344.1 hypothetical protein [Blastococcus sp. MG754427]